MSAQRARSAVSADHRSAHPDMAGVPWWGAVLIAITATAIGFAFDAGSGSKELGFAFAACYLLGCVVAVFAVRQAAVFTAVIQPPLILFASVPAAYYLFTADQAADLKDLAINTGYPLVERFPLMFFTSAGVLMIGMVRWYRGMSTRRATPRTGEDAEPKPGLGSALTAKMSSLFARDTEEDDEKVAQPPRQRRTADSAGRPTGRPRPASGRDGKPASRSTPSRSRHVRPPETEVIEPVADRPRRPRTPRQGEPSTPEPRRRPRTANPRQPGPPPSERRAGYDRVERRRFDDYQPREPHGRNGNSTHHPISRVRYRGEDADERAEYRTRSRTPRDREAESWEYDI